MTKIITGRVRAIQKMASAPILIRAVKQHNDLQMALAEIQQIDEQWIEGLEEDFSQTLQTNPAGMYLGKLVKGNSMIYTEAFVCGN